MDIGSSRVGSENNIDQGGDRFTYEGWCSGPRVRVATVNANNDAISGGFVGII